MTMADATVADAQRVAEEERKWFREHPEPQTDDQKEDELTLWNYPIGKADLAPLHDDAVRKFGGPGLFASTPEHPLVEFEVRGHASVTGAEQGNQDLALRRAGKVEALLKWMGLTRVRSYSAGSSEPVDSGTSGLALAHNRRVTVTRFNSTYPVVEPSPASPSPAAAGPTGSTVQVIVKINLALSPLQAPKVVIAPFIIGDLTVAVRAGDPIKAGVTTTSEGQPALTEGFEKVLVEQVLDPRLGVSAGTGKDPVSISVGVAAEEWFLTPKVGYQHGPNFISFNFKAVQASLLPIVPFNGVEVIMKFSGSIRFDLGPSAQAEGTYPSTSDPGPNVTGTVGEFIPVEQKKALAIAATIADASSKASQLAQADIKKMVLNLARRDGAACRVAWEAIGEETTPAWRQMQVDWLKRVGPDAEKEWLEGSNQVEKMLKALEKAKEGEGEKRANDWKTKYGGATSQPDFEFMREAVFQQLKGYDEDEGDLPQLIEGL
jgi:outer membrane protein OmpA-like peptidoglycan-associated protein